MSESLLESPVSPAVPLWPEAIEVHELGRQQQPQYYKTHELDGGIALAGLFRHIEDTNSALTKPLSLITGYFAPSSDPVENSRQLAEKVRERQSKNYRLAAAIIVGQACRPDDTSSHYAMPESTATEAAGYGEILAGDPSSNRIIRYAHYYEGESYWAHGVPKSEQPPVLARLAVTIICNKNILFMQPRIGSTPLKLPQIRN